MMSETITVGGLRKLLKDIPEDYRVYSNSMNKAMGFDNVFWASIFIDRRYVRHEEKAVVLVRGVE